MSRAHPPHGGRAKGTEINGLFIAATNAWSIHGCSCSVKPSDLQRSISRTEARSTTHENRSQLRPGW